ncbi:hypothetical protein F5Y14DRAFT_431820 [Nemania sp. NC0429]|nr:hypothetical protein F5Y14DRAFT_431820 [Nemania sp. NC0429]
MPPLRRRILVAVLVALLLVYAYVYRHADRLRGYGSPSWSRRGRGDGDGDVRNATLGFGEILVINLPSRRDRRDGMALAGAVSNLNFTFVEGVRGDGAGKATPSASAGARGSWRSHRNALQAMVDRGLGSALVLEDDVDWDVRLKAQMQTFARASRTWMGIWRQRQRQYSKAESRVSSGGERNTVSLSSASERGVSIAAESPYGDGDDWDVLWLGHCGADLPPPPAARLPPGEPAVVPPLRIAIFDDATVPAPKHLSPHPFALRNELAHAFPPHTRVVHAANGNVCSLAYAVSRRGASKLLRRTARDGLVSQWDLMLRDYCMGRSGSYEDGGKGKGEEGVDRRRARGRGEKEEEADEAEDAGFVCLTVQPPLISHHYAGQDGAGGGGGGGASISNIKGQGGGFARGKKGTPYVRLSVQENLERLVAGSSEDGLVDQLPDDGDPLW